MRGDAVIDAVVGDFTSMYLRWDGVLARLIFICMGYLGCIGVSLRNTITGHLFDSIN